MGVNCDNGGSNPEAAAHRPKKAVLLVQRVFLCRLCDFHGRICLSCSADTRRRINSGGTGFRGRSNVDGQRSSTGFGTRSQD
jgi:hypothetical protein